jgi:hypothetical protein
MSYDFRTYHILKIELNKRKGSQHIFDCESHLCCLIKNHCWDAFDVMEKVLKLSKLL